MTRRATVSGCETTLGFKQKGLKFQDFKICPNIFHDDADTDSGSIAIVTLKILDFGTF